MPMAKKKPRHSQVFTLRKPAPGVISSGQRFRTRGICFSESSTLVGNTLHWMSSNDILEFDLDTEKLAMVMRPPFVGYSSRIIQAVDGGVGFAALSCAPYHQPRFKIWERKTDPYGVAAWVLWNSVQLQKILGLGFRIDREISYIVGYAENVRAIVLRVHSSVYMV